MSRTSKKKGLHLPPHLPQPPNLNPKTSTQPHPNSHPTSPSPHLSTTSKHPRLPRSHSVPRTESPSVSPVASRPGIKFLDDAPISQRQDPPWVSSCGRAFTSALLLYALSDAASPWFPARGKGDPDAPESTLRRRHFVLRASSLTWIANRGTGMRQRPKAPARGPGVVWGMSLAHYADHLGWLSRSLTHW